MSSPSSKPVFKHGKRFVNSKWKWTLTEYKIHRRCTSQGMNKVVTAVSVWSHGSGSEPGIRINPSIQIDPVAKMDPLFLRSQLLFCGKNYTWPYISLPGSKLRSMCTAFGVMTIVNIVEFSFDRSSAGEEKYNKTIVDYEPGNGHKPTFFRVAKSWWAYTESPNMWKNIGEQN